MGTDLPSHGWMEEARGPGGGMPRGTAPDPGPERLLWSLSPSPRALLPVIFVCGGLSAGLWLWSFEIASILVNGSVAVIPWTEAGAVRFWRAIQVSALLPLLWIGLGLLRLRLTRYALTTQRLRVDHGLFPRRHDEIALHRIRDRSVHRGPGGMLLGYGTIRLVTRDPALPLLNLDHIPQPWQRSEDIRENALAWKAVMGYREFDSGDLS